MHQLTDVGRLPALLDLNRLRNYLILLARIKEQRGRLQVGIGQRWHAEVQMLALDDLRHHGHINLREVPVWILRKQRRDRWM